MDQPTPAKSRRWALPPHAFFLGVTTAFAGCCLAGYLCSQHNIFHHFERFHIYIAPESLFYPTACQVRQLAHARLDPDKVAVIVGGNSITRGAGQSVPGLWTHALQAELGDGYQVLNLGMNGSTECEFGALTAEMLAREGRKVILVTIIGPGNMQGAPDGNTYNYLFWDAYYKRLIDKYPERQLRLGLNKPILDAGSGGKYSDLRLGHRLDSYFYFEDLWTTLTYKRLTTTWNYLVNQSFTKARRLYADAECYPVPPEQRYIHADNAAQMAVVRCWIADGLVKDSAGNWVADLKNPKWEGLKQSALACFPGAARQRTVMIVARESPYYLEQLTAEEHARYDAMVRTTLGKLQELGFTPADALLGLRREEYFDRCHLAEDGGHKLAKRLAPPIQELAGRLGYLKSITVNALDLPPLHADGH